MSVKIETEAERGPRGCVIALHGRGVRGADLAPLEGAIGLSGLRWIFPDGHLKGPMLGEGRAWFDSSSPDHEGLLASRKMIFELLEGLEKEGFPSDRLVLGGFSQGAVASLDAGLRYPRRLGGIIGMSGFLAWPAGLKNEMTPGAAGIPILLTHGKNDDVLPVDGAREAQAALRTLGSDVQLREYLMGHEVVPEVLDEIKKFLGKVFAD